MCHTRGVGTPLYSAPEILNNQIYDFPADMWSLGVLLFEMIFARTPFSMSRDFKELVQNQKEIEHILRDGFLNERSDLSGEVQMVLIGLLKYDSSERMTLEALCKS